MKRLLLFCLKKARMQFISLIFNIIDNKLILYKKRENNNEKRINRRSKIKTSKKNRLYRKTSSGFKKIKGRKWRSDLC